MERNWRSSIDGGFANDFAATHPQGVTSKQTMKDGISENEYAPTNGNFRALNEYTRHTVLAQSLTQELYGIIDFPEGATTVTFQEIYDLHVESYFSLNINPSLLLDSSITITKIVVPSIANRYLKTQWRDLEIFRGDEGKYEGSSVIIVYDQQLSYYFPTASGTLTLESLVTLPFLTESSRNEFNSKLKSSDDLILQDVAGVSEVDLPPQPSTTQPINSQTQIPAEPLSEVGPQPPANSLTTSPSIHSPPAPPGQTQNGGIEPADVQTKLPVPPPPPPNSPGSPPSNPPVLVPTTSARPTLVPRKADDLETDGRSEGISGLIVIGSLMTLLFIAFTINMKYCMGEYVD